jgi:hypothetical protein
MAQRRSEESPTLPLPPPRIALDDLIEVTAAAALRAVRAQQPDEELFYRPPIWCGIIIDPWGGGRPVLDAGAQTEE